MLVPKFSGEAKRSVFKLRLWIRPVISLSGVAQWLLILVRLLLSVGLVSLYLANSVATASAKGGLPSACAYAVCSVCNLVMLMVKREALGEWTEARSALLRSSCRWNWPVPSKPRSGSTVLVVLMQICAASFGCLLRLRSDWLGVQWPCPCFCRLVSCRSERISILACFMAATGMYASNRVADTG